MKTIKFLRDKKIQLDGTTYKPYCIGDLPPSFGCIAHERDADGDIVKYGISEWFAFKGFATYQNNHVSNYSKLRRSTGQSSNHV